MRYISLGVLSCAGIWLTEALSQQNYIKYTRYFVNMALITMALTLVIFLILACLLHTNMLSSLGSSFNDSVKSYLLGFSIGILPNILMIAITQVFSAMGCPSMIILGRLMKIIIIPTLLIISISSSFSYLKMGITIGSGYMLSAIVYVGLMIHSINKEKISTNYKYIQRRVFCTNNMRELINIIKVGSFSGILISLEAFYLLAALFIIRKFSIPAESTYYIINHLIYIICTIPYAVSLALAYRIVTVKLDYSSTQLYQKKMYKFSLVLVTIMITVLFFIKSHITNIFPSLKETLTTEKLASDFNTAYYLIAIYIILEIPRFYMIATFRSFKKTFSPMLINFICFWPLCLPLGACLAFYTQYYVSSFVFAEIIAVSLSTLIHYYMYHFHLKKYFVASA